MNNTPEEGPRDEVQPAGPWQFDVAVTDAFDDMLARSIPQYEVMRSACFEVGRHYVAANSLIVDIGCSRGAALAPFVNHFGAHNRYLGLEVSPPMLEAARQHFANYIAARVVAVAEHDLRQGLPLNASEASLMLSVLTVQFVPINYRQRILRDCFLRLRSGGALVFVEKVLGATAELGEMMKANYHALKLDGDYTAEQVNRKQLALEGVLQPVTATMNESFLRDAGFAQIDCFWRWMSFAAWIAVKS